MLEDNAFSGNDGLTVYVPDELIGRETAALGDSWKSDAVNALRSRGYPLRRLLRRWGWKEIVPKPGSLL